MIPSPRSLLVGGVLLFSLSFSPLPAHAIELGTVRGDPLTLDITSTSVIAQHFDARGAEYRQNTGWGTAVERMNLALHWGAFSLGARLDGEGYWRRPIDNPSFASLTPSQRTEIVHDNESRYKNVLYPAKVWLSYDGPNVEVTLGDAYAQFGRGLTLSMRKVDELGIDTTLRGAKVTVQRDPFSVTALAGLANPVRVDETSGRTLFVTSALAAGDRPMPTFGSDRLAGAEAQFGRGSAVTVAARAVHFSRCAPYHYDALGGVLSSSVDAWAEPLGTCDATDTKTWLLSLNDSPRGEKARGITMYGASFEVPSLWGHGKLYIEAAFQERTGGVNGADNGVGNALYGALSVDFGRIALTLEVKSNRNFYTVAASVAPHAPELALVAYTYVPSAESFNMLDAEGTGDFNACVNGGRLREDFSVASSLLAYGQVVVAESKTEQPNGQCDALGRTAVAVPADSIHDLVYDGVLGFEYGFDKDRSHLFASLGARNDTRGDGVLQYREQHVEYSFAKYFGGAVSIEIQGRHRHREEAGFNMSPRTYAVGWWYEGENYVALRAASKWVVGQGFEYTTLIGQPHLYFNGSLQYKLTSSSSIQLFVGEQRAAFRCASGICRFFPAFEGVRTELTMRF